MATLLPSPIPFAAAPLQSPPTRLRDRFGRAITDLRVSVTDRCNYRCVYCRTGEHGLTNNELPIADYAAMIRLMVDLGVEKVRLTGGEPLLRAGLIDLIRRGHFRKGQNVVFVHTGGSVALFGYMPPFDDVLAANG